MNVVNLTIELNNGAKLVIQTLNSVSFPKIAKPDKNVYLYGLPMNC